MLTDCDIDFQIKTRRNTGKWLIFPYKSSTLRRILKTSPKALKCLCFFLEIYPNKYKGRCRKYATREKSFCKRFLVISSSSKLATQAILENKGTTGYTSDPLSSICIIVPHNVGGQYHVACRKVVMIKLYLIPI